MFLHLIPELYQCYHTFIVQSWKKNSLFCYWISFKKLPEMLTVPETRRPAYLRDNSHIRRVVADLKRRRQEEIIEVMTKQPKIKWVDTSTVSIVIVIILKIIEVMTKQPKIKWVDTSTILIVLVIILNCHFHQSVFWIYSSCLKYHN